MSGKRSYQEMLTSTTMMAESIKKQCESLETVLGKVNSRLAEINALFAADTTHVKQEQEFKIPVIIVFKQQHLFSPVDLAWYQMMSTSNKNVERLFYDNAQTHQFYAESLIKQCIARPDFRKELDAFVCRLAYDHGGACVTTLPRIIACWSISFVLRPLNLHGIWRPAKTYKAFQNEKWIFDFVRFLFESIELLIAGTMKRTGGHLCTVKLITKAERAEDDVYEFTDVKEN